MCLHITVLVCSREVWLQVLHNAHTVEGVLLRCYTLACAQPQHLIPKQQPFQMPSCPVNKYCMLGHTQASQCHATHFPMQLPQSALNLGYSNSGKHKLHVGTPQSLSCSTHPAMLQFSTSCQLSPQGNSHNITSALKAAQQELKAQQAAPPIGDVGSNCLYTKGMHTKPCTARALHFLKMHSQYNPLWYSPLWRQVHSSNWPRKSARSS